MGRLHCEFLISIACTGHQFARCDFRVFKIIVMLKISYIMFIK